MHQTLNFTNDSLPYIDPPPSQSEISKINSILLSDSTTTTTTIHPSIPPLKPFKSILVSSQLSSLPTKSTAINLSRYDPPDLVNLDQQTTTTTESLKKAYASQTFLNHRLQNLTLLSEFGKNAWLVHNSQLEALLKSSEEELMALKTECSVVNKARKAAQVEIAEEMNRLETHWKRAVGRVLETEVAVEALRREIVDRQRAR